MYITLYFRNSHRKKTKLDDLAQPLKFSPTQPKKMSKLFENAKKREEQRNHEQKALINAMNAINTDEENEGFGYASAWKKRELKRLKRDKKEKEKRNKKKPKVTTRQSPAPTSPPKVNTHPDSLPPSHNPTQQVRNTITFLLPSPWYTPLKISAILFGAHA